MSNKFSNLFWEVFNCNGEKELHGLVASNELLKDQKNWYPYGGKSRNDRSNFGTFENQQPNPVAALIEKVTNSIDALLLKRCKQEGIGPESDNAPSSIEEATEKFFNIPRGDIGELPREKRAQMARDNIQIIATGKDIDRSDLIIWDNGEGQHPDDFRNTFLSIAKNNKTDIHFVQGKYNMGSTGAVVFCGEYRYQLIASKKDQQCFDSDQQNSENVFGWTLVRRHILTKEESRAYGSTWYEYFVIGGETIPQFPIENLNIGLDDDKLFETGSFVKLYSYEMPRGTRESIRNGLNRDLCQLLYKPALPIWLYDKRRKFQKSHTSNSIAMYGNHVRINGHDRPDGLVEKAIYETVEDSQIGKVEILTFVFTKDTSAEPQRNYIGRGRNVIYTLNGQVQGNKGKTFITKNLKLNFLGDSMLIVIDCSGIETNFRQDLFMANRSNLRESEKLEKLGNL